MKGKRAGGGERENSTGEEKKTGKAKAEGGWQEVLCGSEKVRRGRENGVWEKVVVVGKG